MTHHESFEKHDHHVSDKSCRICSLTYSHEENPSSLGICPSCGYKILIVLLIFMIVTSYIAWFGVL
ncbi:MAG: endonuclease Q family protein [Methanoregula sp.]|nr:endonuclease Q family protein [Methanoregula sp.]